MEDWLWLRLLDLDNIGELLPWPLHTSRIVWQHNLNFKAENTLAHEDVANGTVDVKALGLTSTLHEALVELHRLGTLCPQLSGNNNLATLGARFHDKAQDTVASAADGKSSKKLVLHGLALRLRAQATVGNLLGVELDGLVGESETLLDNRSELANAPSLLSEHILGARGADDDLRAGRGLADLDTCIALLGKLTREQLVELGVEHTVGNELALL